MRIHLFLIFSMLAIVLYDSLDHGLPFHYVLFAVVGAAVGRLVSLSQKVSNKISKEIFTLETSRVGLTIITILLIIRLFIGSIILEEFNSVWAADAVYLFFIGYYYARLKNIIRQIDERVYKYLYEINAHEK